jgi:hypothetical protein
MTRRALVLLVLIFAGCGGSSPTTPTTPTGPTFPAIAGTYALTVSYAIVRVDTGAHLTLTCPGTLTTTQTGGAFAGSFTFTQTADCDGRITGQIVNGTVTTDGAIGFDLSGNGSPDFIPSSLGCTLGGGSTHFSGTASASILDAKTGTARVNCAADSGGALDVVATVHGTR